MQRVVIEVGLVFAAATALAAVFLFIRISRPARVTGDVVNNSKEQVNEVVFRTGVDETRLVTIAPGERRPFTFTYGGRETSMTIRLKTARGAELSVDCHAYVDGTLRRADYGVELSVVDEKLYLNCVERSRELKF
jgi:hypothetical protein